MKDQSYLKEWKYNQNYSISWETF